MDPTESLPYYVSAINIIILILLGILIIEIFISDWRHVAKSFPGKGIYNTIPNL